jgi:predicted nucleic acid-binding protein
VRFVDSNVLIRLFAGEPLDQYQRSVELFREIEGNREVIALNHIVIFETVWVLNRTYKISMREIRELILDLLSLPAVRVVHTHLIEEAFDIAIKHNIPFADGYNVAFMKANSLDHVYAWDRHFDRVEGIKRIESGSPEPVEG